MTLYLCESAAKCPATDCKHKTPHPTAVLCDTVGTGFNCDVPGSKCKPVEATP
jgi:hypothetical protein